LKLITKINLTHAIKEHLKSLKNVNTGKFGFEDFFTFIFLPICFAGTLPFVVPLNSGIVNVIITILSIFIGFLINVIVLIFGIIHKDDHPNKIVTLKELIANITFAILISILTIAFCGIAVLIHNVKISLVLNFISIFMLSEFFVTLLMVVKRTYFLFFNEIENKI
jgi:hypothetical protein